MSAKFQSNVLRWPVVRNSREFRAFVVEPREYAPSVHSGIFQAAITALTTPEIRKIDGYVRERLTSSVEQFDLVTFPEAFLPREDLVSTLRVFSNLERSGCVHVGLRPGADDNHLFKTYELEVLLDSLCSIPRIDALDLEGFRKWLSQQADSSYFNVGCVFVVDANSRLRVCLHPKIVRSSVELSPRPEAHMFEADLLTVITLVPTDSMYLPMNLQPLICSDALRLDTDRPQAWPLEAVSAGRLCGGPDHIDVVSVATCTPQPEENIGDRAHRKWHQEFRKAFERCGDDDGLSRHHFATFILANFQSVPDQPTAGLSGAFVPMPFRNTDLPSFMLVSGWGRKGGARSEDNRWSTPNDDEAIRQGNWSTLGHVVSLAPATWQADTAAKMLGFSLYRLPRDTTRWRPAQGLLKFQLQSAVRDPDTDKLFFRKEESIV